MADKFQKPDYFQNRELSWLEFNNRVLEEGLDEQVPLMERLKFFAIVSSNLDEFFMIRVAGLYQQREAKVRRRDLSGLTPAQQLQAIACRAHRMVDEQTQGIRAVWQELKPHGLKLLAAHEWSPRQRQYLAGYFNTDILPILTPIALEELEPAPLLPGMQLTLAFWVKNPAAESNPATLIVVPIPNQLSRFLTLPVEEQVHLATIEEVILAFAERLFPQQQVLASAVFRITRDADVAIQDDDAADLLGTVEKAILDRRRRRAIRLEISAQPDKRLYKWLIDWLKLRSEDVYEIDGLMDAAALMQVANWPGFDALRDADWPPLPSRDLIHADDLWSHLSQHDVMLFHPYERFDPVIQLLEQAAEDPQVMAVKQTLYRTGSDSPVIKALERAAQNGKEVTVLMEVKARFDESRNVQMARRLENAGCLVLYGIVGYKTHSKALLIIRRENQRIRRYVHLSTGNYNYKTAKLYTDIGLMTSDNRLTADVSAFFNLLTGASDLVEMSSLTIAPTNLRERFMELIEREIQSSTPDQPGQIVAKINSLQDKAIIQALYRASRAGVKIQLNVRGICCLRPGIKKISENIEVRSIIDRYLEHPRVFYFNNAGESEVYLSSADWMTRNLDKRLELLFPVMDAELKRRVIAMLETYFADNVKARVLQSDGSYHKPAYSGTAVRAQEAFYHQVMLSAQRDKKHETRFKPLTQPHSKL